MGKCWKCGREVSGLKGMASLPVCLECKALEQTEKIQNANVHPTTSCTAQYEVNKNPEWMQGVLDDDHHIVAALLALFFGCLGGPYFYSETKQRTGVILLIVSMAPFGLGAMLLSPLNVVLAIYFACMRNDDFLLKYKPSVLQRRTKAKQALLEWYSGKPLPAIEPPDLPPSDENESFSRKT